MGINVVKITMSEEIQSLKRKDVVEYLDKLEPKVSPIKPEYKSRYVQFLCQHFSVEESELADETYHDIYMIKTHYVNCQRKVDRMITKRQKFFDSVIKLKRSASPAPSVCIF